MQLKLSLFCLFFLLLQSLAQARLGDSEQIYFNHYTFIKRPHNFEEVKSFYPFADVRVYRDKPWNIMVAFIKNRAVRIQYTKYKRSSGSPKITKKEMQQLQEKNKGSALYWIKKNNFEYYNKNNEISILSLDGMNLLFEYRKH